MTNCKLLHNCMTIIVCAEYQKSQNYSVFPESHYHFYIRLLLESQKKLYLYLVYMFFVHIPQSLTLASQILL